MLARVRTPSSPVRKREREKERERERKRERCRICPELLFLKGMTGALSPFGFLVLQFCLSIVKIEAPECAQVARPMVYCLA